jgi:hypothetical protein
MSKHLQTTSTVGGDLSGQAQAPTVAKINGISVSGTPTSGQSLVYNGTTWSPATITGGGGGSLSMGALDGQTASAAGATIDSGFLYLQSATETAPGIITTGAQIISGQKTFRHQTSDAYFNVEAVAAGKAAKMGVDSTSANFQAFEGKVNHTSVWAIGRNNGSHVGFNIYVNTFSADRAVNIADSKDAIFYGNITVDVNKSLTLSGASSLLTTRNLKITTATTPPTVGQVWTATATDGSGAWQTPAGGGGSGTVTTVSVVSANGLAGTVANPTTTPAITLSTSVTGILKGNGTAISAATAGTDYSVPMNAIATQSADYTANSGEIIPMNAAAAARTVTLPTTPSNNTTVAVRKTDTTGNVVTINPGGSDTVGGGTTTGIYIPGMIVTYRYDTATTDWVITSSAFPTFSTTADTTFVLKSTSASKAATLNLDSGSSTQGNIQGRVGGSLGWMIGRAGHAGFNIYTNGATQAINVSDTLVATFNGDISIAGAKNIVLSATTGTKIGTGTTQKLGFWAATPVAQPTGNVLTALSTTGLVASPTLAESDVTNLVTDLAAKAPLASPTFTGTPAAPTATIGTNTTQLATTAFVLANSGGSPLTTKGDLYTYDTANARLPIGTNGFVLQADSTAATGMKWASVAGTGDMVKATYDPANVNAQLAADSLVVHLAGTETITGVKTFSAAGGMTVNNLITMGGATSNGNITANPSTTRSLVDFRISLPASSTSRSPIGFLAAGSAPTSPSDGNFWYDSTGGLGFRQSTTTRYVVLDSAAQTLTAKTFAASTTSLASFNIASGTAPTSPTNGDIWFDGTDIKMRIGGVTKTFTLV